MASQLLRPSFAFFCVFIKPQHNALILLKLKIKHQSIKVRFAEMAQADAEEVMM
jgi:hypothetical protein